MPLIRFVLLTLSFGVLFAANGGLYNGSLIASAQTIADIKITPSERHTAIEFIASSQSSALKDTKVFIIEGDAPRIVVDFKSATTTLEGVVIPGGQTQRSGAGHVKSIRFADRGREGLRFVFDLDTGSELDGIQENGGFLIRGAILKRAVESSVESVGDVGTYASEPARTRIVGTSCQRVPCPRLAPHLKAQNKVTQTTKTRPAPAINSSPRLPDTGPRYFPKDTPVPRLKPNFVIREARIQQKPVIVIDPGHGGRDPGAIGTRKTKEKTITFNASLELQQELLATGRYDVILTRTRDVYIDHAERLRIARAGGADLFISVHADSTKGTTARGASVYTLADRAKDRSKNIVSTQNWIMDVDLGEQSNSVGDILVDLAQRKTATQSDAFAAILIDELKGSTRLIGNSHRKAGYFVLLAPDVPAVLLELGFLSNAEDEQLLKTASHRRKIVKSVSRAIGLYFDENPV